jgi:putative alpha-1,2-mannosidase
MVMNNLFDNTPDGICGNEDCGQMSAWYIFSSMGFYPVCPGSLEYIIGTPKLNKVELKLDNGKIFSMIANNLSHENFYIQSAKLNGKPLERSYITHSEIMNGGELIFEMGASPNKNLWTDENKMPYSMTK